MTDHWKGMFESLVANLIFTSGVGLLALIGWFFYRHRRRDYFISVALTDSDDLRKSAQHEAANYFSPTQGKFKKRRFFPIARHPEAELLKVVPATGLVDPAVWKGLLKKTLETVREASGGSGRHEPERLHVVFLTLSLWNYALGTMLKNRHGLVLYHFQQPDGQKPGGGPVYHRIWQIDRRVKNERGPRGGRGFAYRFFKREPPSTPLQSRRECLVFQVGANEIRHKVEGYRRANLPDAGMRVYTKTVNLGPDNPAQWIRGAAEIAHAICDMQFSGAEDTYLFMDVPTVMALMAGDAIGDYAPRRVHLMQWEKMTQTYHEVLCLPDADLSSFAG